MNIIGETDRLRLIPYESQLKVFSLITGIGFCQILLLANAQNAYSISYDAAGRVSNVSIDAGNYAIYSYGDNGALSDAVVRGDAPIPGSPVVYSMTPTSGPNGTMVTLTGLDFFTVTGMTINGFSLDNITIVSDEMLTGNIPTGSSSGKIAVTNGIATVETAEVFTNTDVDLTSPQNVDASDGEFDDRIRLTWDPVPGATRYDVYWKKANTNVPPVTIVTHHNTTSREVLDGDPDEVYLFWVKAFNATQASAFSNYDGGYKSSGGATSRLKWSAGSSGNNDSFLTIAVDQADNSVFAAEGVNLRGFHANGTEKVWSPYATGNDVECQAVVDGGKVYFNSTDDYVYCVDGSTGALSWKSTSAGLNLSHSHGVVLYGGRVVTPDRSARWDAFSQASGAHQWDYDLTESPFGLNYDTPVLGQNGNIYVSGEDGRIAKIDVSGGTGVFRWAYPTSGALEAPARLVTVGNIIYAALSSGKIVKLQDNGSTVSKLWETVDLGTFQDAPTIAPNGKVYVTDFNTGNIYSFDPATGASQVLATVGSGADSKLVTTENNTIVKARRRTLYAFDPSGNELWTHTFGAFVNSADLAYNDGVVYAATEDKQLHAIYVTLPPAPPENVLATDGEYSNKVVVSWDYVDVADSYRIYRHSVNDAGAATLLGEVSGQLSFEDLSAEPGVQYYFVSSVVDGQETATGNVDVGYIRNPSAGSADYQSWAGLQFGSAVAKIDPTEDFNDDLLVNYASYAFGLDPNDTSDRSGLLTPVDNSGKATFKRRVSGLSGAPIYEIYVSGSLPFGKIPAVLNEDYTENVVSVDGDYELVEITLLNPGPVPYYAKVVATAW